MNARIFIKPILTVVALAVALTAAGHPADSSKVTHRIGVNVRPAYILPSHRFFRGENELGKRLDKSGSAHLQYSFAFPSDSRHGRMFPTAYQGIGLAWNTFCDKKEIGDPVAVYVFQGATLARLSPKLSLDYEWNFGLSFGWHPYDPYGDFDPEFPNERNLVVGSRVNAYINVGFLLTWNPSQYWSVSGGLDLTHFSNGNTSYPNAGVNTVGIRLGAARYFGPERQLHSTEVGRVKEYDNGHSARMTYDVILYGAGRAKGLFWNDTPYIANGKFGIIGLNINPLYRVNKFFRAGLSLDVQYDESANVGEHVAGIGDDGNIKFFRPPLGEQLGVGLSARAEFVMPIFSVNIGFGRNFIYKGNELKGFYQTLALKTDLYRNLFLHIGYKLHDFHDPNNLMLGLGWRF